MSVVIGLNGRAGAGKDTVCQIIQRWGRDHGYTVRREAFADRLKLSAARIFHPDIELEDAVAWCNRIKEEGTLTAIIDSDAERRAWPMTGRVFLQRYGTEAHREVFGKNFWIDHALADLSADFTVVTDVRFPNEAEAIRDLDGDVWEVRRPHYGTTDGHASEQPLGDDFIDIVLPNVGGLDELREAVVALIPRYVRV